MQGLRTALLLHTLTLWADTLGLIWTDTVPHEVNGCVGKPVLFSWKYELNWSHPLTDTGTDHVEAITWFIEKNGRRDKITGQLRGDFELGMDAVSELPAALRLKSASPTDTGTSYGVNVTFTVQYRSPTRPDEDGFSARTALLTVSASTAPSTVDGQLHAILEPRVVRTPTSELRVRLACGTFLSRGQPAVSVVWKTPLGNTLNSTSYDRGVFYLVLEQMEIGTYSCQIDPKALALSCLDPNSALLKKANADATEANLRLTFLEARLHRLEESVKNLGLLHRRNCEELLVRGYTQSGVQELRLYYSTFNAYCDQTTDSGGWTVIQKRTSGSLSFDRTWSEYEAGFGSPTGDYWLGLRNIYQMMASGPYELRVDLVDGNGRVKYAKYHIFYIDGPDQNYRLHVGGYSGDVGDALVLNNKHNGKQFSTPDKDHDTYRPTSCARAYRSGWWFGDCAYTNLNGLYRPGSHGPHLAYWMNGELGLRRTEMKIRPRR